VPPPASAAARIRPPGRQVVLSGAARVLSRAGALSLPGAALVRLPGTAIGGTLCHWKAGFARFVRRLRP